MSAFGTPDMAFYKLYVACKEVKKYLQAVSRAVELRDSYDYAVLPFWLHSLLFDDKIFFLFCPFCISNQMRALVVGNQAALD